MGHVPIEGVVGRINVYAVLSEEFLVFERGSSHRDAKGFCFAGTGDDAAVVVGEDDNGPLPELGIKDSFARDIE
jgi:hypothetical protein